MPGTPSPTGRFVDLSDYARPLALAVARALRDTRVRAPHVTLVFLVVGCAGAAFYAQGTDLWAIAGALCLQAKNVLDAVDGSLARVQNRPSRIGRFLDSVSDAVVAAALYAALGHVAAAARPGVYAWPLAAAALLATLFQTSVFNYYYVRYRRRTGADPTSRTEEAFTEEDRETYADRPWARRTLAALVAAYQIAYGWADRLVAGLDRWAVRPLVAFGRLPEAAAIRDDGGFLTAVSALGPGLQILLLNLFTLLGVRVLPAALETYLWVVTVGGTLYALALLGRLRSEAATLALTLGPARSSAPR
jgi:phosphatidylglycerophosphate synthase